MNESGANDHLLYRILHHKGAFIGLIVILICTFFSIFAYAFIGDKSKNANEQLPEIALAKPGTKTTLIRLRLGLETQPTPFWIFTGKQNNFNRIAIKTMVFGEKDAMVTLQNDIERIIPYSQLLDSTQLNIYTTIAQKEKFIRENLVDQITFWLGTDRFGRSVLSRLVLGIRISLIAGLLAVLVSLSIGIVLGASSGYFGGKLDSFVMYLINVTWSIPTLLLVFAIVLALGRGLSVIFVAVGLTMWVDVARIARGQVMKYKEQLFVTAATSLGFSNSRILYRHILPNIIGPILVITAANFATAILVEAGLSYLGFGINPPTPSLGNMLNENYGYALSVNIWIALFPALFIMILVLAFNLLGSGLRDIFDIRN